MGKRGSAVPRASGRRLFGKIQVSSHQYMCLRGFQSQNFLCEVQSCRLMQPQTMAGRSEAEDWRGEFVNLQSCRWGFPGGSVV